MSAGSVAAARSALQQAGGGATPTPALQALLVKSILMTVARELLVLRHYLHSFPGGTQLAFGVFWVLRLMGALTLGAGPAQGHVGYLYQATNWLYTGLSQATPLYDIGDGQLYHSRTLSQIYGTHSLKYLREHGVQARLVPQEPKHRYVYLLDISWRERLKVPVLPYPKLGMEAGEMEELRDAIQ